eukprot:1142811-Pelagomonas_calceolata.AAC.3
MRQQHDTIQCRRVGCVHLSFRDYRRENDLNDSRGNCMLVQNIAFLFQSKDNQKDHTTGSMDASLHVKQGISELHGIGPLPGLRSQKYYLLYLPRNTSIPEHMAAMQAPTSLQESPAHRGSPQKQRHAACGVCRPAPLLRPALLLHGPAKTNLHCWVNR